VDLLVSTGVESVKRVDLIGLEDPKLPIIMEARRDLDVRRALGIFARFYKLTRVRVI
jgi:hypothetical protein